MGVVAMRCPRTGREVPTGAEMEREEFQNLRPMIYRMRCPACGSEHVWSKGTALWRGALAESPAVSQAEIGRPRDILDGLVMADTDDLPRATTEPSGSRRISALVARLLGSGD
jgi:hypothetical protein